MNRVEDTSPAAAPSVSNSKWRVLVVDDDPDMLLITSAVLSEVTFEGHQIELATARTADYARKLLENDNQFSVAIIDVVMETPKAGLELVEFIRFVQNNHLTRIVLRTARADQAPAWDTVCHYEIDAYVDKTDPNPDRFLTSVGAALRAYDQLHHSEQQREQLKAALQQRDAMQQELWETQKRQALSKLNADFSREIREPLAALLQHSEEISQSLRQLDENLEELENTKPSEQLSHELAVSNQKILSASQHLRRIFDSLLVFVETDATESGTFALNGLLFDVIAYLRRQSEQLDCIKLELNKTPVLVGSGSEMGQALHNLLHHSIESMQRQSDGKLSVITYFDGDAVQLEIMDNGPGIPDDLIQQASDPAASILSIGEGKFNQLGLSFYVIRHLHQGEITVHDTNPGSKIRISLPIRGA